MDASIYSSMSPVAPHIASFLNNLDPIVACWISHLDYTSKKRKRIVFLSPVIIRLVTLIVLLWRFTISLFWRSPDFLLQIFDTIGKVQNNAPEILWNRLWNITNLYIDYYLFIYFFPGTIRYFCTHFYLRLLYGFRDIEVVFRKSKSYAVFLPSFNPASAKFRNDFLLAINPDFLANNPGFNTRTTYWVLDYQVTINAYAAERHISIDTWKTSIWIRNPMGRWHVHEL